MVWLILALLLGVALAVVVLGLVALPAHREGRAVLTERGGQVIGNVADRTDRFGRGAAGLVASVRGRVSNRRQPIA